MKHFDLNIEKILENWETYHAIREIISNALDEQLLSNTADVDIYKKENIWYIQDYGRGLKYTNLTQKENQEKLTNPNVIGKFGIGLKDALATFDRKGIDVLIKSKFGDITLSKTAKEGFSDIITLHANIAEPTEPEINGTKFILNGVTDIDIQSAKNLFLKFSGERIIETTKAGQVIEKKNDIGNIYINGVKVAEEENFLFNYNITALNAAIKKALNRERTNVGRTAYTDTIKKILLGVASKDVAQILAQDLQNINQGTAHDELTWIDVQEHSVKILNQQGKYVFVSSFEAMQHPDMTDQAKNSGHEIIIIPETLKLKVQGATDLGGNPIVDMSQFVNIYNDSYEFNFIDENQLNEVEKNIYNYTNKIISLFGGLPKQVQGIKISTTMKKDFFSEVDTLGCWDPKTQSVVIARKILNNLENYSGILIHELIHAKTGYSDVTRIFETELTEAIGMMCAKALSNENLKEKKSWFNF